MYIYDISIRLETNVYLPALRSFKAKDVVRDISGAGAYLVSRSCVFRQLSKHMPHARGAEVMMHVSKGCPHLRVSSHAYQPFPRGEPHACSSRRVAVRFACRGTNIERARVCFYVCVVRG